MAHNRIKILHVITSLDIGGAETMLHRLLVCMDSTRFESQVVCLIPIGPIGAKIQALGIPVYSLNMKPGQPSVEALFKLTRLLRRLSPDLVQTWLYHADLLGALAAKTLGLPVLWNIRASNMNMSNYRRLSKLVLGACIRLSAWPQAVVVNSRAGQDFHERIGYHPRRWALIPNGMDTARFQPNPSARLALRNELGLPADTLLIGLVARYDRMKDHECFLQSSKLLASRMAGVHFVLAGNGVEALNPCFKSFLESEQLIGRLHLLGERDDIPELTAALDIASSSSAYGEGFSNTIAEAMSCAVPCVVTDVGDSAFLVDKTGIVVPPNNPQALADAWQHLISIGVAGRNALGQIARQRIQKYFQQDDIARQYESLYESFMTSTK
jgi:glycosyltransferase involved in cell wall biosynthesis